jgi:uncharacterized membrane protein
MPPLRPRRRAQLRVQAGDGGQVLLLVLVYTLLAFLLVTVVADAAAVHLERNRLVSLTDASALNAAEALDSARFYQQGPPGDAGSGGPVVPVSDASVRAAVTRYLALSGADRRFTGLDVAEPTGSADGVGVEVTLSAVAHLPVLTPVVGPWWRGVPLRVTSRAQARAVP